MKLPLFLVLLLSFSAFARDWESVYIPGAKCGDGIPYKVFVKPGKKSKLAIELMGGGACWSLTTCWGPNFHTWIHPIPELPAFSYLSTDESPIKDHTFIYFPYCNGDVHAGNHDADYLPFVGKTYHHGYRNFVASMEYLSKSQKIQFRAADSLVLWGSSAGALGSLIHKKRIESYLKPGIKKVLIADSPGLHYANDFWKKFTPELIHDFKAAFAGAGVHIDVNQGMIAPLMKDYCREARGWKIGFIQTTRDIIMSKMFGGLSEEEHKKAVLGPSGIRNVLKNSKVCSTHISEGVGHMLLLVTGVAEDHLDLESGESAKDFVDRLIKESGI